MHFGARPARHSVCAVRALEALAAGRSTRALGGTRALQACATVGIEPLDARGSTAKWSLHHLWPGGALWYACCLRNGEARPRRLGVCNVTCRGGRPASCSFGLAQSQGEVDGRGSLRGRAA
jgi:hypothetical protein